MKGTALACCLLLAALWAVSIFGYVLYGTQFRWRSTDPLPNVLVLRLANGRFDFSYNQGSSLAGGPQFRLRRATGPPVWLPSAKPWGYVLPLWIPLVLVAMPTVILWTHDHRPIPLQCCTSCGYNLTGNTSGTCPECGEAM